MTLGSLLRLAPYIFLWGVLFVRFFHVKEKNEQRVVTTPPLLLVGGHAS